MQHNSTEAINVQCTATNTLQKCTCMPQTLLHTTSRCS